MNVKTTFFTALLLAAGGITLLAQDGAPDQGNRRGGQRGGPGGIAALTIDKLKTELKLTDEQATKLTPLLEELKKISQDMRKQLKELRDSGADRDAMKTKMTELRAQMLKTLEPAKEFLSADQYKALTEKLNRRPPARRGGPDAPQGGNGQ